MPIKPLAVGELRQQLVVYEKQNLTPDASGQVNGTYTAILTTRGKVEPISARESERAKSFGVATSHKVTMRYNTLVTTLHQIGLGARRFLINGILNTDERNYALELFCEELT